MGAVSGDINTLSMSVDTAVDLSSRTTAALKSGDRAFITAKVGTPEGPLFFIDKTSVLAVDGVGVLATNSGVGRWLSEALYGGFDVNDLIIAANVAALGAASTTGRSSGTTAWVNTFRCYFRLDTASAEVPNGKTIVAANGGGNWLRSSYRDLTWASQTNWEIDPTNGNDENTGIPSSPLATWAEFTRRVKTIGVSMTVTILDDIAENLIGDFDASAVDLTLTVQSQPAELATGTVLVAADPVPATNSEGTLTSAAIASFAPYVGRIVECTSTAAATCQTVVLADAAGTAQVPFWAKRTNFSNPLPGAGAAIRVLDLRTVPSVRISGANMSVIVRYFDITGTAWISTPANLSYYEACEITAVRTPAGMIPYFVGCALKTGGTTVFMSGSRSTFVGGASFQNLTLQSSCAVGFSGTIVYGRTLAVGNTSDFSELPTVLTGAGSGLGVFNSPGVGVAVQHGGAVQAAGPIYGDGNTTYGMTVTDGGTVQIAEALTPTITGAIQALQVEGANTAISPLVPGGAVPAASPLTIWADWAAPPFSRAVMNYTTGSRISGV